MAKNGLSTSRRRFLELSAIAAGAILTPPAFGVGASAPEKSAGAVSPEFLGLSRTTFGVRPEDLAALESLGNGFSPRWERHVEAQLHPMEIPDGLCEARLARLNLSTLNKSLEQLWKDHVVAADALRDAMKAEREKTVGPIAPGSMKDENALRLLPARESEIASWVRAVYSERQLQEVLADFWHDHFNVFAWDNRISPVFVHYDRDVIRAHMLGNFREFLEAVAKSPAMLHYLDNEINQSGNPNENYARELFELHTLGAENYLGTRDRKLVQGYSAGRPIGYVDGDVYEAARAFTGWRVDQGPKSGNTGRFDYFDPWHDRFQKIVLGASLKEYQPPLKDGHDVLDRLAAHPGTARHVSRKLCRHFVADEPSDALVEGAAKVFLAHARDKEQLKRVTRFILLSEEFSKSWGRKLKRPFEYVAGVLRVGGVEFTPNDEFIHNYERTGQRLWGWRTPDGAPDVREKWASGDSLIERWRLTNLIVNGHFGAIPVTADADFYGHWERRIFSQAPSPKTREKILAFLSDKPNEGQARMALGLLFMAPENQWR